ncbi:YhzD family protein [Paludifilum halophilum]|nr:YhzD family protein [Paludifilum halophilum]
MYHLTVYNHEGNKLYDEGIQADTDNEAKEKGHAFLGEKEATSYPFRLFHVTGRLVEFQSHKGKKAKEKA